MINGGAHAANRLPFQKFMVAPTGAPSMAEAIRCGAEVYAALKDLVVDHWPSTRPPTAFCPATPTIPATASSTPAN